MKLDLDLVVAGFAALMVGVGLLLACRTTRFWGPRLWRAAPRQLPSPPSSNVVDIISWTGIVLGSAGLCTALSPNLLGLVAWLALVVVLAASANRAGIKHRKALLRLIASAVQAGLPLEKAVLAFSRDVGGRVGRQSRQLADLLAAGVPLSDALVAVPGLTSRRTRALITLGHESGTLVPTLADIGQDREQWSPLSQWLGHVLVASGVLFVALSILTFVMLKIVPAFTQIFQDFDAELPAITQTLIAICVAIVDHFYIVVPIKLLLIAALLYLVAYYVGWVEGDLPLVGRLARRFNMSTVLRGLAVTVEAGKPLGPAIAALARSFPSKSLRRGLNRVVADVLIGRPWLESLQDHRLISNRDAAVLEAAVRVGNLPWAMRHVADSNEQRLVWKLQFGLEVLTPPLWIVFGVIVGFIVLALFMPLIKIIETLT